MRNQQVDCFNKNKLHRCIRMHRGDGIDEDDGRVLARALNNRQAQFTNQRKQPMRKC